MKPLPQGRDLMWMYGYKKQLIEKGIGMYPEERAFYLALKFYFEKENINAGELSEIVENGTMREDIRFQFLQIIHQTEQITPDEKKELATLYYKLKSERAKILDKYLIEAGSSLKKSSQLNLDQAIDLFIKVLHFKQRRLNVTGAKCIYMDLDSFLHIYMRHVEELKFNKHFEHKNNFQWNEDDVISVMQHVIRSIDEDVQKFVVNNPGKPYNRYGKNSVYFQGDYYTIHVEPDGRVSTFYKNRKEHEKKQIASIE